MAKANKASRQDIDNVLRQFDSIKNTLENIADTVKPLMPLLADALEFDTKLVKLYKDSFKQGMKE